MKKINISIIISCFVIIAIILFPKNILAVENTEMNYILGDVNNNGKYSKDRFLVSYPHVENYSTTPPYRFHIRRNTAYVKDHFEESLFLQGLVRHSKDNLIVCRNTRYDVSSFSIQKFVFQHCDCSDKKDVLKAL